MARSLWTSGEDSRGIEFGAKGNDLTKVPSMLFYPDLSQFYPYFNLILDKDKIWLKLKKYFIQVLSGFF